MLNVCINNINADIVEYDTVIILKTPQNKNYDGLTSHYQCTYPNGRVIENTYNNLHQAELVMSDIRGTSALETVADYDYLYDTAGDKRPLLSKMTYDSDTNVSVNYGYDELGRSTKKSWVTLVGTGSIVVGFENAYDEYGNRLTDKHLHKLADSETYQFDSAQRFTKYERGTIGQTPVFTQGYTLDDIGNWTSFDNNGSTESRSYSSTNELTTQGTHSLSYDDNGNGLDSKNHKYIWDELNRLIEVQDNASNTIVTYYYDVHNLRVLKDFGATDEVRYYYCGNKVIEERDENEVLEREYIMGKQYVDEVLVYIDHTGGSAVNYFYMTDLRFSNYAIIDGLGNLIERYRYNGYGEQIVMDSSFSVLGTSVVDQFYGYTGRRLDSETSLMYFRARYYDVDQGRFINRDPLGYVDGMGLYNGYFAPRGMDPEGMSVFTMTAEAGRKARTYISGDKSKGWKTKATYKWTWKFSCSKAPGSSEQSPAVVLTNVSGTVTATNTAPSSTSAGVTFKSPLNLTYTVRYSGSNSGSVTPYDTSKPCMWVNFEAQLKQTKTMGASTSIVGLSGSGSKSINLKGKFLVCCCCKNNDEGVTIYDNSIKVGSMSHPSASGLDGGKLRWRNVKATQGKCWNPKTLKKATGSGAGVPVDQSQNKPVID